MAAASACRSGGGGLGIGTIIVLGLISYAFGIDPRILIGGAEVLTGGRQTLDLPDRSTVRAGQDRGADATRWAA